MSNRLRIAIAVLAMAPATLVVAQAPAPTPDPPSHPDSPNPAVPPATPDSNAPPSVTVLGSHEVQGILGNEVRNGNDNMGRIVDVIVDGEGKPRAAIIDFGGFLGVGSRKIAVDWKALHFVPGAQKRYSISLELSREQVKAAPEYEYKEGEPIIVLGASGILEPIP